MYSDILIPTDGSREARAAIDHGTGIASRYDATVHALHVVDTRLTRSGPLLETLLRSGREAIREVEVACARSGRPVVTDIVEGNPAEAILAYVAEHDVDLVVMGTHGRTGIDRVLMGSVAERVVRRSPVPVVTVRDGSDG
jgi:nucleotide-binding universal stress UspA family protein